MTASVFFNVLSFCRIESAAVNKVMSSCWFLEEILQKKSGTYTISSCVKLNSDFWILKCESEHIKIEIFLRVTNQTSSLGKVTSDIRSLKDLLWRYYPHLDTWNFRKMSTFKTSLWVRRYIPKPLLSDNWRHLDTKALARGKSSLTTGRRT